MKNGLRFVALLVALTAALVQAACGDEEIENQRYGFRQSVPSQGVLPAPLETKTQVLHRRTDSGIDYMIDVSRYAYSGVRETTTRNLPALQRLTDLHLHLMSKSVRSIQFQSFKLGSRVALQVSFELQKRWQGREYTMQYLCVLTVHRGLQFTFTIRNQSGNRFYQTQEGELYDNRREVLESLNLFSFTR
jgi:hypothetical protein